MERSFTLQHEDVTLAASIHYPPSFAHGTDGKRPLVVIVHGFVGSRIGVDRLFVLAAREFARRGSVVIRFDLAGCGESEGIYGEHGLDSMIAQTRTVLDYGLGLDCVDPMHVSLIGHSLGGAVALLTAARDRRVKSLALWSAVGHPYSDIVRIVGRAVHDEAYTQGRADYAGYALKPAFFESLQRHQPFQQAAKFRGDVFLAHGTSDDVIPADYAFLFEHAFWQREEGRFDKRILFQADHAYTRGEHKAELFEATAAWLDAHEERQRDWHHWSI